jgi:hypothetical protein
MGPNSFIPLIALKKIWPHFKACNSKDEAKNPTWRRSPFNIIRSQAITICCHPQKDAKLDKIRLRLQRVIKGGEISWAYGKSLLTHIFVYFLNYLYNTKGIILALLLIIKCQKNT